MAADSCPFERAVQTVHFSCAQSRKTFIGEKEGVVCTNPDARQQCVALVAKLKQNARFALKLARGGGSVLTHGQEMKLKCGGLQGLRELLGEASASHDIHDIISTSLARYPGIDELPYADIMRVVTSYKLRGSR